MEFSSRGFQRSNTRPAVTNNTTSGASSPDNQNNKPPHKKALHKIKANKALSVLGVILFVSALVLVIAVLLGISTKTTESSKVDKDQYQAVFLNGGQAYFGKISTLNDRYIDLNDIYYISTNGQSGENSQANISLIKLGSELHCPQDRMIINREQVLFWENLNDDGKVVNAIKQWQKENPNGQKCNNQTTQQQNPASTQSSENQGTGDSTTSGSNATPPSSSNSSNSSSSNAPTTGTGTQQSTPPSTTPSDTPTTSTP